MFCGLCHCQDLSLQAKMLDSKNILRDIYRCRVCAALTPEYDILTPLDTKSQIDFHEKLWNDAQLGILQQELFDLIGLVNFLRPHLGVPSLSRRILEIGAGRGGLLRALRDVGYSAYGCEPATKLVAIAREHYGLSADILMNIEAESMLARTDHDYDYDVVILWHTLEHFSNPLDIMHQVSHVTSPDGVIIIQVPLMRQSYIYPEHYYFCSHESLSYIAAQIRFNLIDVMYDHENLYVTAVFSRNAASVAPGFLDYESIPDPMSQILLLNERTKKVYSDIIYDLTISKEAWEKLAKERLNITTPLEQLINSGLETKDAILPQKQMLPIAELEAQISHPRKRSKKSKASSSKGRSSRGNLKVGKGNPPFNL